VDGSKGEEKQEDIGVRHANPAHKIYTVAKWLMISRHLELALRQIYKYNIIGVFCGNLGSVFQIKGEHLSTSMITFFKAMLAEIVDEAVHCRSIVQF
jgi:hypothetical protein